MHYYISLPALPAKDVNDYEIFKVEEADEANFLEKTGDRIIVKGKNLVEEILNLSRLKEICMSATKGQINK